MTDTPLPPFLPAIRARRLTLTTADYIQEESVPGPSFLSNYGFFGRLPVELRHQILTAALGGRTLHIDLNFDHPPDVAASGVVVAHGKNQQTQKKKKNRWDNLVARSSSCFKDIFWKRSSENRVVRGVQQEQPEAASNESNGINSNGNSNSNSNSSGGGGDDDDVSRRSLIHHRIIRDKTRPKTWQWLGCVCHRQDELTEEDIMSFMSVFIHTGKKLTPGWDSCCTSDVFCICRGWSEERRKRECELGIFGWLLTCRQAYTEGIDILYNTNTFHLASRPLLQNLPSLLVPQHLASIRSLELLWTLKPVYNQATKAEDELHQLCEAIPEIFPNLNKLFLCLYGTIEKRPPGSGGEDNNNNNNDDDDDDDDDAIMTADKAVLDPVKAMLRRLPQGGEYNIAVSPCFWMALLRRLDALHSPGLRAEVEWTGNYGKFWRCLDSGDDDNDIGRGYWVHSGCSDGMGPFLMMDILDYWGLWRHDPDPEKRGPVPISCPVVFINECPYN